MQHGSRPYCECKEVEERENDAYLRPAWWTSVSLKCLQVVAKVSEFGGDDMNIWMSWDVGNHESMRIPHDVACATAHITEYIAISRVLLKQGRTNLLQSAYVSGLMFRTVSLMHSSSQTVEIDTSTIF